MDHRPKIDEITQAEIARCLGTALTKLGVDLTHDDLRKTPERIATLWAELFAGLDPDNTPSFTRLSKVKGSSGMVLAKDLRFYSLCAHHLLPFFGRAHIAYHPAERIAGLGDLTRVLDFFSRRPTLQERIATQVAGFLDDGLSPRGVAVLLEGRHLCMEMRGQKKEAGIESSAYRGIYEKPLERREFLERIRLAAEA